jgi:hypothetical protein
MTRRPVELQTDAAGQLRGVQYHDGYMVTFTLSDGLTFGVRAIDNSFTEIVLTGVKMLCTDPLWEAAIVTDIDVWKAIDAPVRYWENLFQGRSSAEGIEADKARHLMKAPDGWIVEVGTAYGGGFTCFCAQIDVFQTLPDA